MIFYKSWLTHEMYRVLIIRSLAFILSPLIWSPLNSTRNKKSSRINWSKKGRISSPSLYWCINMPYSLFSTSVVKVWYTNYIELFSCWMSDWQYGQIQSLKMGHWLNNPFWRVKVIRVMHEKVLKITDMFMIMMSPILFDRIILYFTPQRSFPICF